MEEERDELLGEASYCRFPFCQWENDWGYSRLLAKDWMRGRYRVVGKTVVEKKPS